MTVEQVQPQPAPRPVVFVAVGPSTAPLVQPLQATGCDVVVGSRAEAQQFPGAAALEELMDSGVQGEALSGATILAAQLVQHMGDGSLAETLAGPLQSLSLHQNGYSEGRAPVEKALLEPLSQWFPGWVHQSLSRQMVWLKALEKMVAVRDVRAIVCHNDVEEFTKTLCLFAAAHNIPSIHVPHAVYLDWGHGPLGYDVHDVVSADWVCCAGWFQAEWYKMRHARKVAVTGLPQWDMHAKLVKERDRALACRRLKLDEHKKVVVYYSSWAQQTAAQGFHDGVMVAYRSLLEVAKAADWQLVVKTHPHARLENMEWHGRMAHDAGVSCLVTDRYLDLAMQAADLCVAYGTSATVMESALYGTPLVSIAGFEDDEAVITCGDTPDSIGGAIQQALSDEWAAKYKELRQPFITKYAGRVDGNATKRVVEHIVRIGSRGPSPVVQMLPVGEVAHG